MRIYEVHNERKKDTREKREKEKRESTLNKDALHKDKSLGEPILEPITIRYS
jgi:hypothetical protein